MDRTCRLAASAVCLVFFIGALLPGLEGSTFIPANNTLIKYTGRVTPWVGDVIFDWPCVAVEANISGSSIYVTMNGGNNFFQVIVDGVSKRLGTDDAEQMYELASRLEDKPHHIAIHKLTEATYFVSEPLLPLSRVTFKGFLANGKKPRIYPLKGAMKKRKIELIGDSNSNGFGIEGPNDWECFFSFSKYENCYEGYGGVLARMFDAELHLQAWTGMGVVKNAVDIFPESSHPMPAYLNRTIATDEHWSWDFNSWVPDLVLVMLGCNDYMVWPSPTDDEFVEGYTNMLRSIFLSYSGSPAGKPPPIISLCGGHSDNNRAPCKNIQTAVKKASAEGWIQCYYVEIGNDWLKPDEHGCLDHRNVKGQQVLAARLKPLIQTLMGW